jgi:S1-C subfamily serine protease
MGVPVITAGDEVIVGFDRPRLEKLASRFAPPPAAPTGPRPKIGLRIKSGSGGAEIGTVHPGSPAEQAGLRPGDIVVEVGGRSVRSASDLEAALGELTADQTVALDIRRNGKPARLRLKL